MRIPAILTAALLVAAGAALGAEEVTKETSAEKPKTRTLQSGTPGTHTASGKRVSPLVAAAKAGKNGPKAKISISKDTLKTTGGNITTTDSTYNPKAPSVSVVDTSVTQAKVVAAPQIDPVATQQKIRDLQAELSRMHDEFVDESEDPAAHGDFEGVERRMNEIPKEIERLQKQLADYEKSKPN